MIIPIILMLIIIIFNMLIIIVIIIVLRGFLECCGTRGIVSVASVSGTLNHTHVEKNKPFGFPLARLFTQTAGHVPRACLDRGGFSKLLPKSEPHSNIWVWWVNGSGFSMHAAYGDTPSQFGLKQ